MTYGTTNLRRLCAWLCIELVMIAAPVTDIAAAQSAANAPVAAVPNGLSFAQIKITGDEFVVLRNNSTTAIPDLSSY